MTQNKIVKSTLVNIDSTYRNLYPKNICYSDGNILPKDPLSLTQGSPIIQFKGQDIYICEIDEDTTNLNDFYRWEEVKISDTDTFCWRTFVHITDLSNNIWLPIPSTEKMSGFKIQDIIKTILDNKSKNS